MAYTAKICYLVVWRIEVKIRMPRVAPPGVEAQPGRESRPRSGTPGRGRAEVEALTLHTAQLLTHYLGPPHCHVVALPVWPPRISSVPCWSGPPTAQVCETIGSAGLQWCRR